MRRGKSPQNINEELNKMRRLMNFDISQNSHDVLSESNIERSVLSEQPSDLEIQKNAYALKGKKNKKKEREEKREERNRKKEDKKKLKQMLKNGEITKDEYSMMLDGTIPNWGTKMEGKIKMDVISDTEPLAMNIGIEKYRLYKMYGIVKTVLPDKDDDTEPIKWETPDIKLLGDGSLPFADNMVTPAWDKFPNAKSKFDDLITKIADFIAKGGFDYIKSITIQGSADSARPTEDVPHGYDSLDHPDGIYGGETDDFKRNQYLADTRAKQYALAIINAVKEETEKDLSSKFIYKKGLNYFGSEGKERGPEFRSITLNIDADDIPGEKGEYMDFEAIREKYNIAGVIKLLPLPQTKGFSQGSNVPVIEQEDGVIWIPNGGVIDGVDYDNIVNTLDSENADFNGKKYVDGILRPNAMKIDDTIIPGGQPTAGVDQLYGSWNKAGKFTVVYGDPVMEFNGRKCLLVKSEVRGELIKIKNIAFGIRQILETWDNREY